MGLVDSHTHVVSPDLARRWMIQIFGAENGLGIKRKESVVNSYKTLTLKFV